MEVRSVVSALDSGKISIQLAVKIASIPALWKPHL
jgi:hypothetical protein